MERRKKRRGRKENVVAGVGIDRVGLKKDKEGTN